MRFEIGKFYGTPEKSENIGLIQIIGNTGKSIKAIRVSDYGKGGCSYTADDFGEHRYKIYVDEDGDEYTIIDRFRSCRFEVWGTKVSSNPKKKTILIYISG